MMKKREIERRFLLYPCSMKRFLQIHGIRYRAVSIEQFYVVADASKVERYRKVGERYIRTFKQGSGLVRDESEEPVSKEVFETALKMNSGGVIRKTRRIFSYEGFRFELDSFKEDLKGLNILEIEFASEQEAEAFVLPPIFRQILAAEVTDNRQFTNGAISRIMHVPSIETPLMSLIEQIEKRSSFLKASTQLDLAPFESGAHAVKGLFYTLLKSIEANKAAILSNDRDPERLHQLRVAMRKLRAIFSQMSPLFDEEWLQMHKERLATLMRKTGEKRDIDVYLLHVPLYKSMVSEKLHPGIDTLKEYLQHLSEEKEATLKQFLTSESFEQEIETLLRFATTEKREGLAERAEGPVILEVKSSLRRRYKKILKKGGEIKADSEAHQYHMVRIDVKKLRYMMEFFASILDDKAYPVMLKKLKTIQTILGDHQDLDVQRSHLKAFAELPELHNEETVDAIRELRRTMEKLEKRKREEFREAFKEFAQTQALFRKMICRF